MADSSVTITPGSGTTISTRTNASGEHMQVVTLGIDGVNGIVPGDDTFGLASDVKRMPAAARTTDAISSSLAGDLYMIGLNGLTPKFAKANIAASTADGSIVAAVASKKIRVLLFRLHCGVTATSVAFRSKPAGAGTEISELFALGANGGHSPGFCLYGHFETVSGEGLTLNTGAGSTVGVGVVYVEV